MPRLRHYDHLNTARLVTFSCYRRHRFLTNDRVMNVFIEHLRELRERYKLTVLGYVIMSEHVHLVLHPPDEVKLGPIVGELKSRSARQMLAEDLVVLPPDCRVRKDGRERNCVWQPRGYDHNCRTGDTVLEKINYSHNNPVTRCLVSEPGEWRWSSYNWYMGATDVPLEMDSIEKRVAG